MIKKGIIYVLFILLIPRAIYSDLNKQLNHFFDQFGSSSNINSADIYNGQKAGYLTGGGLSIRNRVMVSKPITVSLPKFDAGCGGIDIFAGGFSFINHQQLVATLKSIGSNAQGYAFLLGLETISPQTANTIKQLQSWANTINSIGINSCEVASQLTGAVWPANTMASQQICRSLGNKGNTSFHDYISARHKCSTPSGYDSTMQELEKDSQYKGILKDEYNIAWEAAQRQEFLKGDSNQALAELFMSLMGTIIIRREGQLSIEKWPSKIDDESFLRVLLEGGKINGYSCSPKSKNKCLILVEHPISIAPAQSWLGKVRNALLAMQNKILADVELDQSEKELLAKSRLPLYKIVNVLTAYKRGHCPIDLLQVADTVAIDLLIQYLREAAQIVIEGCHQLRREQMFGSAIDDYLKELEHVQETIRYYEVRSMQQREQEFQLIQKIDLLEEKIASELILN